MTWGAALIAFFLYPGLALVCHWLSCRLPGHPLAWFCLFTGLLAANEHYIAWTLARLPGKVPLASGMALLPVMVFAFFEYRVYWAAALWPGWMLIKLSTIRKTRP